MDSSAEASDSDQISPDPSLSRGEEDPQVNEEGASLIKEGDHEVVEDLLTG
jgi:hypothetical protein